VKALCIVIPVYNNPDTIGGVVSDALQTGAEVIVVDDGSVPKVSLTSESDRLHLLRHGANAGKGEAILTGGKKAEALGYASFFVVDADGQHFAREVENFAAKNTAECIVIGCRRFGENVPGSSKFGRAFSNFWIRVETGLQLHDTQSGFRSYPVSVLNLPLRKKRYDFEIEILVRHAWSGGCIEEVGIEVHYPEASERISHFHAFKDNLRLSMLHTTLVTKRWLSFVEIK
jgi:glycosyltransferase involved in cell wall biosynthesis